MGHRIELEVVEEACKQETWSEMACFLGKRDDVQSSLGELETSGVFKELEESGHGRRM